MRIILSDFMSLDGVVQAPGGKGEDTDGGFAHGGWSMPYFDMDAMGPVIDEGLATTDALLFGRRTWQVMAAAWPGRAGDPFADRMNKISKYVASRTLTEDDMTWSDSTLPARRRRPRRGARAARPGRKRPAGHGKRLARPAVGRARPGRRVPAYDRADPVRRGQASVPRRRPRSPAGPGVDHVRRDRCADLHVPPGRPLTQARWT